MRKTFIKNFRLIFIIILLTLVAALLVTLFLGGSVSAKINADSITLKTTFTSQEKILFSEIESIELKEDINVGARTLGVGGGKLQVGNFKNDEYGNYKLFSYSTIKKHVVIKTAKGYFVYNLKNERLTQNSYENLLAGIN